jgi:hypothetical protein
LVWMGPNQCTTTAWLRSGGFSLPSSRTSSANFVAFFAGLSDLVRRDAH